MNLTNKTIIKDQLKKQGIRPEKYLGQHFILSKKSLAKIIEAAEIKKNDTIIEIGSGLGTLTQELAKTGAKIIAIEKDPKMISILKETLVNHKNIKIVEADARQLLSKPTRSPTSGGLGISGGKNGYKIVANLPYNIATFLIRQWLELKNPPELMILMIQKEVAQRICAKPPHLNLLAVGTQFLAIAKVVDYVPAEAFWPKPKVDSAIIKIVPKKKKEMTVLLAIAKRQSFLRIVKAGFSQPRKQLIGNLAKKLKIPREKLLEIFKNLNIPEHIRAENLSLDQWLLLVNNLYLFFKREENTPLIHN